MDHIRSQTFARLNVIFNKLGTLLIGGCDCNTYYTTDTLPSQTDGV